MSTLVEIQEAILGLAPQDKRKLLEWLDEHSEELSPPSEDQAAELLRRKSELLDRPGLAQPLEAEFFDGLRRKVAEMRARY